jgi:hypothetical protein
MRPRRWLVFAAVLLAADASTAGMRLESPAFRARQPIPARHTCDGEDLSPPLAWKNVPAGVRAFALFMEDPDAPAGTWIHWVLYDLPGTAKGLPEGVRGDAPLPGGGKQGASWGVRTFERAGYSGPCPPPGKPHRYVFTLWALDSTLKLPPKATRAEVAKAMRGHVLARAELVGTCARAGR